MDIFTILLIAVGLAMDALAVSITGGMAENPRKKLFAVKIAAFFGLFQGIMPVIGWMAGYGFRGLISSVDHWIAFGLLSFVGCKMIVESRQAEKEQPERPQFNNHTLFILSIATSIDALAVGLSFSFLDAPVVIPALIIAAVTFSISFGGVFIGDRFGHFLGRKAELFGGIILLGIGFKILFQHLT